MSEICERLKIRLLLINTDCVFSGKKGFYSELDVPDCNDLYGISKLEGKLLIENMLSCKDFDNWSRTSK